MKFSPRAIGLIAALVTILIWTSFIVIARASASHSLLPLDIAFLRIVGAGSVLLPWAWWLMRPQRQAGEKVGSLLGLSPLPIRITIIGGLFGSFVFSMLSYSGFFFAPATHASVLLPGSLPLWTTLMAWLVLSQSISKVRAIGLVCIVLGDLLVGGSSLLKAFDGGEVWKGDVMFMCAACCWSFYTVIVRKEGLDAVRATMAVTAFSFVTFLPLYALAAWVELIPSHLGVAPWQELLFQALYQGIGSVVISGISFNMMVRHYGPVRSTMMTAVVPALSALSAVVLLDEPMYWNLMTGLALVTCGILFGVRKSS
jgi:drug/metabolite transporter (DMT)-like permease